MQSKKTPKSKPSTKPFLKWAGGKRRLISSISSHLPATLNQVKNFTYIEPFIGSGAVLFWFLQNYKNIHKAVINDINPDLTIAYQVIKNNPTQLIECLNKIQTKYYSLKTDEHKKEYYLKLRARFNERSLEDIDNTSSLLFLNKTCYNGLYRVNRRGQFNVPFGRYNKPRICAEQNLLAISQLLQKVIILNGDYTKTIDYASKNSFFYFDPPYKPISKTSSFNSYASRTFNDVEQERLYEFCKQLDTSGHDWMVSNSDLKNINPDNNYFDDLYKNYTIKRIMAKRSINSVANNRGEINELLIYNY